MSFVPGWIKGVGLGPEKAQSFSILKARTLRLVRRTDYRHPVWLKMESLLDPSYPENVVYLGR